MLHTVQESHQRVLDHAANVCKTAAQLQTPEVCRVDDNWNTLACAGQVQQVGGGTGGVLHAHHAGRLSRCPVLKPPAGTCRHSKNGDNEYTRETHARRKYNRRGRSPPRWYSGQTPKDRSPKTGSHERAPGSRRTGRKVNLHSFTLSRNTHRTAITT